MDITGRIEGIRQSASRLDELAIRKENRGKLSAGVALEAAAALRNAADVLAEVVDHGRVPRDVELP
jgi:hypothetical protein